MKPAVAMVIVSAVFCARPARAVEITERVQVTATRIPEGTDTLPGSLTVITRDDLIRRGVRDLASAMALVSGVSIAPGGDVGPAGSVPEFWGLREFDAFLLTVDGVPWGGAFTPALETLDLNSIDRIEILRGAAPVMYGAASFVGVINVIHRTPGEGPMAGQVSGGSYDTGVVTFDAPIKTGGSLRSSIDGEASRQGFKDDRAGIDRGLVRWRGLLPAGRGIWRFNAVGIDQRQNPASPRPLEGTVSFSPLVPLDTNQNMQGSHLDDRRYALSGIYEHPIASGDWSTQVSATRSHRSILRGFLTDLTAPSDNANGFSQRISITDLYFDSHISLSPGAHLKLLFGLDHLHGDGHADGGDFDYTIGPDGSGAPNGHDIPVQADVHIDDRREFSGLYGQGFWDPAARWHLEIGVRANRTQESRSIDALEFSTGTRTRGEDRRAAWRGGGTAGLTFIAWQKGADDLRLFADYRNTYKPAVTDFGLDSSPEILAPETGESYEGGLKTRLAGGRFGLELSAFQMDLKNIVVGTVVGGLPALQNVGAERLRGIEVGADVAILPALFWRASCSLHDARFGAFLTDEDGVPTQVGGNRLEMSARQMASTGFTYGHPAGWQAWTQANYVGSRFLDRTNETRAPAYVTWDAGVGYRVAKEWEVRLDGRNLNGQRPPVSESELGDGQYYFLPARAILLGLRWTGSS